MPDFSLIYLAMDARMGRDVLGLWARMAAILTTTTLGIRLGLIDPTHQACMMMPSRTPILFLLTQRPSELVWTQLLPAPSRPQFVNTASVNSQRLSLHLRLLRLLIPRNRLVRNLHP